MPHQKKSRAKSHQERSKLQESKTELNNSVAHLATNTTSECDNKNYDPESAYGVFHHEQHQKDEWFADSACTQHMTEHRHYFKNFSNVTQDWTVKGVGGQLLKVAGKGDINVKITNGPQTHIGIMKNVLHVPGIGINLFSIVKAADQGVISVFKKEGVYLYRENNLELFGVRTETDVYQLNKVAVPSTNPSSKKGTCDNFFSAISLDVWHQRFGHAHHSVIKRMKTEGTVIGLTISNDPLNPEPCKGCALGKSYRKPFPNCGRRRASMIGEIVHSDLCGPMSIQSLTGSLYYILFHDDASGFRVIYFIKKKSETFACFKKYSARLFNETGKVILTLRSDNGGEYVNEDLQTHLATNGIRHETCAPYTPQQNGVSERSNRTLMESARSILQEKDLPRDLWAEAVNTAVYVNNRIHGSTTTTTPYEMWYGRKPDVSYFRIFGTFAYVHIPDDLRSKLDAKSQKLLFIGYSETQKAYRFFDRTTRRITVSRNAIFCEVQSAIPSTIDASSITPMTSQIPEAIQTNPKDIDDNFYGFEPVVRKSSRIKIPKIIPSLAAEVLTIPNPNNLFNYNDAVSSSDSQNWVAAMKTEIEALNKLNTWTLVPRPLNRRIIKCRWVFAVKRTITGTVERYRARLVAKGFSQKAGIDFDETFSPVIKYDSLRVILSIAAAKDLDLYQFDVASAFLYGDLSEEIYLEQPEGFPTKENHVYRLHKCLYGLKQAGRVWNSKFDTLVTAFGLIPSIVDPCVYHFRKGNVFLFLCLWVDDGLVVCNTVDLVTNFFKYLKEHFEIKPKIVNRFVGIDIMRDRSQRKLYLSQPAYAMDLLSVYNLKDCDPVSTPADTNSILTASKSDPDSVIGFPYRSAVGALIHLCVTRPDLNYAVGQVAKYSANPNQSHVNAVKRILAYVKGTRNHGICFGSNNKNCLVAFFDADHARDMDDRKSTTGYVILLNGGSVAWGSRRQQCVSLSTTEAEYVAACETARQVTWLRNILHDVGVIQEKATPLFCDNQGAIHLSKNPEDHKRTKHIDIQYHYVRKCQSEGTISVEYVPSVDQLADMFTKALPRTAFESNRNSISVLFVPDVSDE